MSFRDDIKRLAPNEPNINHLVAMSNDVHDLLDWHWTLDTEFRTISGEDVFQVTAYVLTLEQTLINWLNLEETEKMRNELE